MRSYCTKTPRSRAGHRGSLVPSPVAACFSRCCRQATESLSVPSVNISSHSRQSRRKCQLCIFLRAANAYLASTPPRSTHAALSSSNYFAQRLRCCCRQITGTTNCLLSSQIRRSRLRSERLLQDSSGKKQVTWYAARSHRLASWCLTYV